MKAPIVSIEPLPAILVEPIVRAALLEDLGRAGDITTNAIVGVSQRAAGRIVAREAGRIAGIGAARLAFKLLDDGVRFDVEAPNGAEVAPGDVIARVEGPARALLTGEGVALNF